MAHTRPGLTIDDHWQCLDRSTGTSPFKALDEAPLKVPITYVVFSDFQYLLMCCFGLFFSLPDGNTTGASCKTVHMIMLCPRTIPARLAHNEWHYETAEASLNRRGAAGGS